MAQVTDYVIDNGSGSAVRADINAVLDAVKTWNKGASAPSNPAAGMIWVEDDNPSSTRWTVKMHDGTDWISLGILDANANRFESVVPPGGIVDRGYAEYLLAQNLNDQIPLDDTIPTSSEGSQILSVAITPKSATNRLRVRFAGKGSTSIIANWSAAIFNGGSSAIAADWTTVGTANTATTLALEHEFVAGTTSSVTITVRVGPDRAADLTFNGNDASTRYFGGVARGATLVVEEIVV